MQKLEPSRAGHALSRCKLAHKAFRSCLAAEVTAGQTLQGWGLAQLAAHARVLCRAAHALVCPPPRCCRCCRPPRRACGPSAACQQAAAQHALLLLPPMHLPQLQLQRSARQADPPALACPAALPFLRLPPALPLLPRAPGG